jgi:hypothetical protein
MSLLDLVTAANLLEVFLLGLEMFNEQTFWQLKFSLGKLLALLLLTTMLLGNTSTLGEGGMF